MTLNNIRIYIGIFIVLVLLIGLLVLSISFSNGSNTMKPYYQDAKVTCYKDYASGNVSCVKN